MKTGLLTSLALLGLGGVARAQVPASLTVSQENVNRNRYALSAYQTDGTQTCGNGNAVQFTPWTIATELWWSSEPTPDFPAQLNTLGGFFNGGTFTAPVDGIYYLSAFGRCEIKQCDVTLLLNNSPGQELCGFGTDLIGNLGDSSTGSTWYSTGCATIERLTDGQSVGLFQRSGSSGNCLRDTSFRYNHFNVLLYFADGEVTTFVGGP